MVARHLSFGLHAGVEAARYHADDLCAGPTLSSSIAKTLLNKTERHARQEHPRLSPNFVESDERKFDLGSVAHELILERGGGYEVLDFPSWATKASKEARAAAREAGKTPVLVEQYERAQIMARRVRAAVHDVPGCEKVFNPKHGNAEVVGLWRDIGGPVCRLMTDWIGPTETDIFDLKTTGAGLSLAAIEKTIDNLGYDLSAGFYLRGLHHLKPALAGRFRWRWVFVEDEEPFEVRVVEPEPEVIERGHRKAALAIAKWHRALTADEWPGYVRKIARVGSPRWAEEQWNEREADDPDFNCVVLLDNASGPTMPDQQSIIFGESFIPVPSVAT